MLEKPKKLNVPAHKEVIQIKITLIGDAQSGKTSFAQKYANNNFPQTYQPTLGADSIDKHLTIKNQPVHITFWDMSGKIDFLQIRNQIYKQSHLVMLFVDLSNKSSIQSVNYWLGEVKDNNGTCPVYIIGNKADNKRSNPDFTKQARERQGIYVELSCKTGEGINQLMQKVVNDFK